MKTSGLLHEAATLLEVRGGYLKRINTFNSPKK